MRQPQQVRQGERGQKRAINTPQHGRSPPCVGNPGCEASQAEKNNCRCCEDHAMSPRGLGSLLDERVTSDLVHPNLVLCLVDFAVPIGFLHPFLLTVPVNLVSACAGCRPTDTSEQGTSAPRPAASKS